MSSPSLRPTHQAQRPKSISISSSQDNASSPREMATSIPIPSKVTSDGQLSPPSSRSLLSSSLSSYRSHPYPRRPSQPQPYVENHPRIHLPPPNSSAPLHVNGSSAPRDRDVYPGFSGLALNSPPGGGYPPVERDYDYDRDNREKPPALSRSTSASILSARLNARPDRSLHLPPFQSFSSASPSPLPTPPASSSMPPPALTSSTNSASNSTPASPKLFSMSGLRPSYSYDTGAAPSTGPSASTQRLSPGGNAPRLGLWRDDTYPTHSSYSSQSSRASPGDNGDHTPRSIVSTSPLQPRHQAEYPSPPLRSVGGASYSPEKYLHQVNPSNSGRSRSHSAASAISRGEIDRPPPTPREGAGQSRRLAHLLSEQKRRESINTGFQSLRMALPNTIATDSKAIILRKAVNHITLLENLLRKAGIPFESAVSPTSIWEEADVAMELEEDRDLDADLGEEAEMQDTLPRLRRSHERNNDTSRGMVGLGVLKGDKEGWEEVHVENVDLEKRRGP